MCVRTSTAFYGNFILDMDRSPGFGSALTDFCQLLGSALLRLDFSSAPDFLSLTLPVYATRRTVLQKVRGCTYHTSTVCKHRVSGSLSLPSRGSFHLSFTVLYAIGHWVVFSLTGWSPLVPTRFHVSRGTLDSAMFFPFSLTGLSPSLAGLSRSVLLTVRNHFFAVQTPICTHIGLGSIPFARRYLGYR